jgi:hypothetical protein
VGCRGASSRASTSLEKQNSCAKVGPTGVIWVFPTENKKQGRFLASQSEFFEVEKRG